MSRRTTYRCIIKWNHRTFGPQMEKCTAEGTSIRRAISSALLEFFTEKNSRDKRRDAHVLVEVLAHRVKTPVAR